MDLLRLSDYDCIGFDLDSTLLHYNITNLVRLQYKVITNFLITKKGYDPVFFKEPLSDKDVDFLQKGLIFDLDKGNLLKLAPNGKIYQASHGTKLMSAEEIEKYYPNHEWELALGFTDNPLIIWGVLSIKIRTLLNCFDMTAGLVFAKVVDAVDKKNGEVLREYKIWPDIMDSFSYMYSREHLKNNEGHFYAELVADPGKYIHKCSPEVLAWIKRLREKHKTFLITGSNSDFVELTTAFAFEEDLNSLFDIVVCYGQKPGFFTDNRPFFAPNCGSESEPLKSSELKVGESYNQGNWNDLYDFFARVTNVEQPKCLYIGDNLLQDIYTPSKFTCNCDTLVVSDEHFAEKIPSYDLHHPHEATINSDTWGSFFTVKTPEGIKDSYWGHIIKKHAKVCVPNLEVLSRKPLHEPMKCFKNYEEDKDSNGFYPGKPSTL